MKSFIKIITLSVILQTVLISCGGGGSSNGNNSDPIIVTPDPPSAAILVFPDNNQTCQEGTDINDTESEIEFKWNVAANTDTYDLSVTNINTGQQFIYNSLTVTSKKVNLTKGDPFSWKVVCKSSKSTQTATSLTWKFYMAGDGITNYAPFPATLSSPASGVSVTPTNNKVTLSWEGADPDSGDTLIYTAYFDTIDGKQTPSNNLNNLTSQSVEVDVVSNTIYYWRIKSSDGQNSSFSVVYTFRTD